MYGNAENPLFLAKDVAAWIEHSDVSMMMRNVDDEEKVTNIVCTHGGNQNSWFLTEDGLYEFFMQLNKQHALKLIEAIAKAASLLRDNVN